MSGPLDASSEQFGRELKMIIDAWEKDPVFSKLRYFDPKKGFGPFYPLFPTGFTPIKGFTHSIVKVKIDEEVHYALFDADNNLGKPLQSGSFGSFRDVPLLMQDEKGNYKLSGKSYGVKSFHPEKIDQSYKDEIHNINDLIRHWPPKASMYSKKHGFNGVAQPTAVSGIQLSSSLVRMQCNNGVTIYGVRREEESPRIVDGKHYELIDLLKVDANGRYYFCGKEYCIQILKKNYVENDFEVINQVPVTPSQKQVDEAKMLQMVDKGGDLFSIHGVVYVGMTSYPGLNLRRYMDEVFVGLGLAEQQEMFMRIMQNGDAAIRKLHVKGVLHRDIKPENIIVGRDGRISLVDFGLSKAQTEVEDGCVGTPGFFPLMKSSSDYSFDERATSHSESGRPTVTYDQSSDKESWGRTLFQFLGYMQNCYFKQCAALTVIFNFIFMQPQPEKSTIPYEVLQTAHNLFTQILRQNAKTAAVFNNMFVTCFQQEEASSPKSNALYQMAHTNYEIKGGHPEAAGKLRRSYSREELEKITRSLDSLGPSFQNVCNLTTQRLLENYASLWVTLFYFHWGRKNRKLVNEYLASNPTPTVAQVNTWAAGIFEKLPNQQGELANTLRLIQGMGDMPATYQSTSIAAC